MKTNKLQKTRLLPPYKNGKPTFKKRNKPGVYLIYDYSNNLRYVGYSGNNLYRTMYHHFQAWNDEKQIRITYNPDMYQVRVIYTHTPQQAQRLEKALIIHKKPTDNPQKYWITNTTDEKEEKIYHEFNDTPVSSNLDVFDVDSFII